MTVTVRPRQADPQELADLYTTTRALTDRLVSRLSPEDQVPQSMTSASPVAWHRAHTTWFFEEMVLGRVENPGHRFLFNSYYEAIGDRQPRPQRGMITRPSVAEIAGYRADVDKRVTAALEGGDLDGRALELLEMGCHHEQQHQELLLMDFKHLLSLNPTDPVYLERPADTLVDVPECGWVPVAEGVAELGAEDSWGFSYDNERPRHRTYLPEGAIADRQVTVGEWKEFMADGGYRRPELWLSDGWASVKQNGWEAPGYWRREEDSTWTTFTLSGRRPVVDSEPVVHISFYEAHAFATWAGHRLPTEAEWESVAGDWDFGDELDPQRCHPGNVRRNSIGGVWEWTQSAYLPYPGFQPEEGVASEYNGKFMSDQYVLRGASALTPAGHSRKTYRNFFPAESRWVCAGLRLATGPIR
ncbi:ergothioneine biosynthesis protein EgtB [Corynebacterium halotolerans]|uniref:Sulfatase-modifying factor enzyme domain-containing protein n=1 Tax=Corynebacterium halotolerans YIM 70093 = DSM 44683 TaxID=1121362 RepID=M1MZB0_9CORY|nr:ergothioneine biosynthesis protein EgtB [Corynebacterium halotolerans]AGF73019.1 hypothetical protein A605_10085 [Corynebacterium halotolerans YIM 70093 = DSM 44683]